MTVPSVCPTSEQLKALVDGVLPVGDQTSMQKHVDACAKCQKLLESLVAGSQSWNAAMQRWRDNQPPLSETVLADAMKRMKADEFGESTPVRSIAFNPTEYLEPSTHPGSVGKLGSYEVTEVIGQGGMGVVLKAFDPSLHRVVAVKVLAPYLAHNPLARQRFVREALAIAAVSHDHVITIHQIDESPEQPKIVMQYVAGRSLQQKIDAEGTLDLKEILRIGMQTASGLAAAHAQGLVHRDVKPSNILLENGIQRVKLTDFGLARAVDDASLTQSGVIAGTPQYMAPEQANGDAVDSRADLFSLGSVMYAMCVGHSPFRASTTMGVLKRVCHDAPRPIQEINPDIPDWLCAIITKLLQKRPEDRFSTAREVAELLEHWLAHVQQPIAIPKPVMPAPPFSNTIPVSNGSAAGGRSEPANHRDADRALDRRTIFFQTVSWRWFSFFMLLGIAITLVANVNRHYRVDEVLSVGVISGLALSFIGLLIVGLVRFLRANILKKSSGEVDDQTTGGRPNAMAPETMAVLAAIIVVGFHGHLVLAVIVAIIVWRVAKGKKAAFTQPQVQASQHAPDGAEFTRTASATKSAQRQSNFEEWIHNAAQTLVTFVQSLSSGSSFERNRLLIAIGWCIAGGVELATMKDGDEPIVLLSLVLSLLAFATSLNVYSRQNLGFIRAASFVGLLPFTPGLVVRIPMSVITLIWQSAPATREFFDATPWSESRLGRWINGPIRLFGTLSWMAVWSISWTVFLAATVTLIIIPFGPSRYIVHDEAKVTMTGHPDAQFRLAAFGTGDAEGLRPPTKTYRRQEVLIEGLDKQGDHRLRLRLGPIVRNESTLREVTESDLERFFSEEFGAHYPAQAANLFAAIQRLNETGGFTNEVFSQPEAGWRSLSERLLMTKEVLHRTSIVAESQAFVRWDKPVSGEAAPPQGFIELRSMLDPRLFQAENGQYASAYGCSIPSHIWELGLGAWVVVWLLGIRSIAKRRHSRRAATRPVVTATA